MSIGKFSLNSETSPGGEQYIAIPIGCLDDLKDLLSHYKISPIIKDERNRRIPIDVEFIASLKEEQLKAAKKLMKEAPE